MAEYEIAIRTRSDIRELLPILLKYAGAVRRVTEFGTRDGYSTIAFLAARPLRLTCYDLQWTPRIEQLEGLAREAGVEWTFHKQDILKLREIAPTDLLFIDSRHTREQVAHELTLSHMVERFILLHDTETFAMRGEGAGEGIWPGISQFLRSHPEWDIHAVYTNSNGLTILRRQ